MQGSESWVVLLAVATTVEMAGCAGLFAVFNLCKRSLGPRCCRRVAMA